MNLNYKNYRIRSACQGDADLLCGWWNDGDIMAHAGFPHGLGTDIETIQKSIGEDSIETRCRMIIEVKDRPIGEMSYRNKGGATAEIGIKICIKDQREKGIGSTVLNMLVEYLFYAQDYRTIILDTGLNNRRAQHVYEKIGFERSYIHFNVFKDQVGKMRSSVVYELNKDKYRAIAKGYTDYPCPVCKFMVTLEDAYCPVCGVNLK